MSDPQTNHNARRPGRTIAVLSDVHGNLPALEAVLEDAQKQGAEEFWNLGDLIGYGPYVNKVIDLLFDRCSLQVIGNYDRKVLDFPAKRDTWKKTKNVSKYTAFEWTYDHLSPANAARLQTLPVTQQEQAGDVQILLTHGSPEKINEWIGPETPDERLRALADSVSADLLLCGHTHVPFQKKVGDVTFLNPGSVGRPEGGDPRACYLLLNVSSGPPKVRFCRVDYDIERMARALRAAGLPDDFVRMIRTGRNLDQVQDCQFCQRELELFPNTERLRQVRNFAETCHYEAAHSEQVTYLAQHLFNKLASEHRLGKKEFFLLTCAGLLHDIGYQQGVKGHHKTAMEMILRDSRMPLDDRERRQIALIARYHRKAPPGGADPVYAGMSEPEQNTVRWLAGILRVADGLDRSHLSDVRDVRVKRTAENVLIRCLAETPIPDEIAAAQKKADLLEQCLGLNVVCTEERSGETLTKP